MTWYAVHETVSGALRSVGEVLPERLPDGLTALPLLGRPDLSATVWDAALRAFAPRPAKAAPVDRWDDFVARPGMAAVLGRLNAAQAASLRDAFNFILGPDRFRRAGERESVG